MLLTICYMFAALTDWKNPHRFLLRELWS